MRLNFFCKTSTILFTLVFVNIFATTVAEQKIKTNSIGIKFVLIPSGSFMMGSQESEYKETRERPRHKVTISKSYYLSKFEITQEQWVAIMGENNPSRLKNPNNPVENVSWEDTWEFIQKLNKKEKTDAYRLPTEAEWEYAARAGTETAYCYGDSADKLNEYAWYAKNSRRKPQIVGTKKPNSWGLHDMHGNVEEWCRDKYEVNYYSKSPEKDPQGPTLGRIRHRAYRGGSFGRGSNYCRSASRYGLQYNGKSPDLGFRILMKTEN